MKQTTMSNCRQCGQFAEHYNSVPTACKECWKAQVRNNRKANAEHYRGYDRERGQTPERKAAYAGKQRRMRADKGPGYMAAHSAVARAVKSGSLIRPDHCSVCLVHGAPQAHHDDHSKKLDVMWLCPVCHAARHVELSKMKTVKGLAT
jgi:hypothetical protein